MNGAQGEEREIDGIHIEPSHHDKDIKRKRTKRILLGMACLMIVAAAIGIPLFWPRPNNNAPKVSSGFSLTGIPENTTMLTLSQVEGGKVKPRTFEEVKKDFEAYWRAYPHGDYAVLELTEEDLAEIKMPEEVDMIGNRNLASVYGSGGCRVRVGNSCWENNADGDEIEYLSYVVSASTDFDDTGVTPKIIETIPPYQKYVYYNGCNIGNYFDPDLQGYWVFTVVAWDWQNRRAIYSALAMGDRVPDWGDNRLEITCKQRQ